METVLRVVGLSKHYAGVTANDNVDFDLESGEVHCLFGENGAGKSTLTSCIFGLCRPDSGEIFIGDEVIDLKSPRDALQHGIGMVHQHFVLVPEFTVLENIIVGTQRSGVRLETIKARAKLTHLCRTYGLDINLDSYVWELPVGRQQWVEILKALYLDARILILDEPTAVLTPIESERLFAIMRTMCANGLSVVLITHKIAEVMKSDRVTVLRRGRTIQTLQTKSTTPEALIALMVGRSVSMTVEKEPLSPGRPVLEVANISAIGFWKEEVLRNVSLSIAQGEILGIAGVAGNGQKELFEVLSGVRMISEGAICLNGRDVSKASSRTMMDLGVGHIPDDRFREGLVGSFSIAENLILGWQRSKTYRRGMFLSPQKIGSYAKSIMEQYRISAPEHKAVAHLSGGNAQKVIIAREFSHSSCLLLANQPTRGLDLGVIDYVYRQLLKKRSDGYAVLLASEDLGDLFSLADRIAVMFKGQIVGVVDPNSASIDDVGALMAGQAAGVAHV